MVPAFTTFNKTFGMAFFGFIILGIWYTNVWNTGYLPINSNRVFDHHGSLYNVSRAINEKGMFDEAKYMDYSAAYLSAANTIVYFAFFAIYAATISHIILFHRAEIAIGFKNIWKAVKPKSWIKRNAAGESVEEEDIGYKDVHNRLMAVYPEGEDPFLGRERERITDKPHNSFGTVVLGLPRHCHGPWLCWCCRLAHIHHCWCRSLRPVPCHHFRHPYWHHQGYDGYRGHLERVGRVHRWCLG